PNQLCHVLRFLERIYNLSRKPLVRENCRLPTARFLFYATHAASAFLASTSTRLRSSPCDHLALYRRTAITMQANCFSAPTYVPFTNMLQGCVMEISYLFKFL